MQAGAAWAVWGGLRLLLPIPAELCPCCPAGEAAVLSGRRDRQAELPGGWGHQGVFILVWVERFLLCEPLSSTSGNGPSQPRARSCPASAASPRPPSLQQNISFSSQKSRLQSRGDTGFPCANQARLLQGSCL